MASASPIIRLTTMRRGEVKAALEKKEANATPWWDEDSEEAQAIIPEELQSPDALKLRPRFLMTIGHKDIRKSLDHQSLLDYVDISNQTTNAISKQLKYKIEMFEKFKGPVLSNLQNSPTKNRETGE